MRSASCRGYRVEALGAALGCLAAFHYARPVHADDGTFLPAPAAQTAINFDGRGFLIYGQRTFIVSGSLDYARVPRALWRDRLLRLKRAGFNTVQTDVFWNLHEPREGRWDFQGEQDLDAFLILIRDMGLYATVCPGPYVGAEWAGGGLPLWLRFKPQLRVREHDLTFEAAVDHWYEHVLPIIAANQIQRGGAVIMVQLEHEHPQGAGRELPDEYFHHLHDKAVALGLEVPCFFSGLHSGNNPAGDKPWDSRGRASPWYSSGLQAGGPNRYGALNEGDLRQSERALWKVLAYGGNGYNLRMAHGGTNFGAWGSDEVAASNDYGAAVGQAGDLRPLYASCKRAAWFARTFADILEDSENATDKFTGAATDNNIHVTARRGQAGTILFLDNDRAWPVDTRIELGHDQFPSAGPLTIGSGEIMPVVLNYPLAPGITLDLAATRILGITTQDETTTLVVYGPPGSAGELRFSVPANRLVIHHGAVIQPGDAQGRRQQLIYNLRFPDTAPRQYSFTMGAQVVRILVLSNTLADRTWFVDLASQQDIVIGPDYVGDATQNAGHLQLVTERQPPHTIIAETAAMQTLLEAAAESGIRPSFLSSAADGLQPLVPVAHPPDEEAAPTQFFGPSLITWQVHRGDAEAQPQFSDDNWTASQSAAPMGADGDAGTYTWYRAHVQAGTAGDYALRFSDIGDWASVFVNGQRVGNSKVERRWDKPVPFRLHIPLKPGDNTLAVFTAQYGRSQLKNYLGPLDTLDAKGINGAVTLGSGLPLGTFALHWRWKADARGEAGETELADPALDDSGAGWHDAKPPGEDVFNNRQGFVWYRTTLGALPGPGRTLHFEAVDDNATVYLNGHWLLHHTGWNNPFDVPLDAAWNDQGPNIVAVLVENNAGPGGIRGAANVESDAVAGGEVIHGWKMHGGPGRLDAPGDAPGRTGFWQPFNAIKPPEGYGDATPPPAGPTFYRTRFTMPAPPLQPGPPDGLHLIFRISWTGLSRGMMWLNGHNLGRYPEKLPVKGLYLPECWITPGPNTLILYDEEGNSPGQVRCTVEEAASRIVVTLEPKRNG